MSKKKDCSKNQRALKQVQNKQKAQRGRSMVEMLGVLAVMGILSVAGVAGYGITMDKYKATDLINDANVRAADVSAQIAAGNTPNLNGFDDDTFTGVELVGDKQFKLNATGIKESVCNHMKTIVGTNGIIREIADDCSYLLYNNFLSAVSENGAAVSDDGLWEPTLCSDNNDCGTCEQCMPWGECYKVETEECQCASNEMLVDMMGDGSMMSCIPCNYHYSFPAELTQNCETKCGQNRSIVEGLCAMTRCPSGYFLDNYYECQSCNITDDISVNSASDCSCSNRTFSAGEGEQQGICVLTSCMTGYFKSADNGCLSCNEPGEVYVYSEADCSCSNRRFVHAYEYSPVSEKAMADPNDGYCILDTCSSGHFKSKWDGCVACDELASYAVSSESDCSCTNRRFISDSSASVIIMIASGGGENEEGYCALKNCPNGYFPDDKGNCERQLPEYYNGNSSGCTSVGYKYCSSNNKCVEDDCCSNVSVTACQECISSTGEIVTFSNGHYCYQNNEDGKCDTNANCMTPSSYNNNNSGCTNAGYHYCGSSNECVATDGACCSRSDTCYQCNASTGAVTMPGPETSCNYNNQGANSGQCSGTGYCNKIPTFKLVSGATSKSWCTNNGPGGAAPYCSGSYTTASLSSAGISSGDSAATVRSKLQSLRYVETSYSNQVLYLTDAKINSDGTIMETSAGSMGSCLCVSN